MITADHQLPTLTSSWVMLSVSTPNRATMFAANAVKPVQKGRPGLMVIAAPLGSTVGWSSCRLLNPNDHDEMMVAMMQHTATTWRSGMF